MKLRELCFFKETPYGNGTSIDDAISKEVHPSKEIILSYLDNGVVFAASFGLIEDVISGEIIGPQSMLTDGIWIWGSDLSTYVKKYNVKLPEEFVERVKRWDGKRFDIDISSLDY